MDRIESITKLLHQLYTHCKISLAHKQKAVELVCWEFVCMTPQKVHKIDYDNQVVSDIIDFAFAGGCIHA